MENRMELPLWFWRAVSRVTLALFFDFEVRGLEHLHARKGALILAGNHQGLLDTPMITAAVSRPFRFVMAELVFGWGWIGKMVRHAHIIPLAPGREKQVLSDIVARLKREEAVCIFPEGKLTEDGGLGPFREGAAFLHAKSGAPIIPFAIYGGFETWPIDQKAPSRHRRLVLQFGPPLETADQPGRAELTARLQAAVSGMWNQLRSEHAPVDLPVNGRAAHAEVAV